MANQNDNLTATERIQAIMDELGVDWEAAALLFTIENGDAFIDDIVFESSAHQPTDHGSTPDEPPALAGSSRPAPSGVTRTIS